MKKILASLMAVGLLAAAGCGYGYTPCKSCTKPVDPCTTGCTSILTAPVPTKVLPADAVAAPAVKSEVKAEAAAPAQEPAAE